MRYQQFCPIAKALELLGEKWSLLIIREALMGATRFGEFQRGMPLISPAMLTKRLKELTQNGLLVRRKIPGQKGYEYHLSQAGKELQPIVRGLGDWGTRWARGRMEDSELDVELLVTYLGRSIRPEYLPGKETTIQFNFTDLDRLSRWWIVASPREVDVCLVDPGRDVDVWLTTDLRTMVEIWMGDITYRRAIREKRLKVIGAKELTRNLGEWMANSPYAEIPRPSEIVWLND